MPGYTPNIFKGRLFIFITLKRFTLSHKLSQCLMYKIVKNLAPRYLTELLPKLTSERTHFRLRPRDNFSQLRCRISTFQKSFFPSAITGWNSLDLDVRNSVSLSNFKFSKLIGVCRPFTSAVLTLNRWNTFSCTAQGRQTLFLERRKKTFKCFRSTIVIDVWSWK